ncbi:hypothetical protein N7471_000426 [Penicillium samsonianum]|uniref:uncharacterized protein n=1 Tax=Penicillium samsonianum TaxID=1882272 RepID=UPI00254946AF|nr:uncharacterized protein N7471_000426 [Penicillium samsonianum]KAJ6149227.1 hypothetical protein N7471_000426 [Penicillium samsonianum]
MEWVAESAAAWLDDLPQDQTLRKAAQPEGLYHLGLKCPGPGRVVDGLVQGTQVCSNDAIISFETGVFYRDRSRDHIGLKCRCPSCNGRFMFNSFLRTHYLEAGASQRICSRQSCISTVWEGSKFCHRHFLAWTPDLLIDDKTAIDELRSLFEKAASEQWRPETEIMADLIMRMESDSTADIRASEMVCIDLETNLFSREVLQIGLTDLEGRGVLDCLTEYGDGSIAPSSSRLSAPATWRQIEWKKKVKAYFTHDGTLDAKGVVEKLQYFGISNKPFFLSWASWCFDLSYLRDWLRQEGYRNVLPGDGNVWLLLSEFRKNVERAIGTTCYRDRGFPLSLPVVFTVLFGDNHPLSGRNHNALVDAQQLSLMARLFIDLCKAPDKRVHWQESGIKGLGMGKRQKLVEEYFPKESPKKKARAS